MKVINYVAAAGALLLGAVLWVPQFASAQPVWPTKPVRIISPGAAGGTSDILFRIASEPVLRELGQPLILENKPGAGSNVAGEFVAKSAPDGYTFVLTNIALQGIGPALYRKLNYDPIKDLSGVARMAIMPNVLIVNNDLPAKTVRELIAYAKANPGKLNYASNGAGSSPHLSAVMFSNVTGTEMVHIPYKGSSDSSIAMLKGDVQLSFENLITCIQNIKSGKVRALAVTSSQRSPQLPDVPTMSEAGVQGFEVSPWYGIAAPAGTPKPIVERFAAEIGKSLRRPEVAARIRELGVEPAFLGPTEFDNFVRSEAALWAPVVRASGAYAD